MPGWLSTDVGGLRRKVKRCACIETRLSELAGSVETVINGVQATVQGAGDPMTVGKLTACVGAPFKGALDAVGSVKANVNVSVTVQASASGGSASGTASASGKAG